MHEICTHACARLPIQHTKSSYMTCSCMRKYEYIQLSIHTNTNMWSGGITNTEIARLQYMAEKGYVAMAVSAHSICRYTYDIHVKQRFCNIWRKDHYLVVAVCAYVAVPVSLLWRVYGYLNMCACIYKHIHACIYIYIYIYTSVCLCLCLCACTRTHAHTRAYTCEVSPMEWCTQIWCKLSLLSNSVMSICVCSHAHYVCVYACVCMYVCVRIHRRIYVNILTHRRTSTVFPTEWYTATWRKESLL